MNMKNKLRRLKTLMYKQNSAWQISRETVMNQKKMVDSLNITPSKWFLTALNESIEIYAIADELGLSQKELENLWFTESSKNHKNKEIMKRKPQREGRDNKDVYVGSGGYNRNMVRYPSKKRSIKTWKKFYKLFPLNAIEDGWNGKTSKRMK